MFANQIVGVPRMTRCSSDVRVGSCLIGWWYLPGDKCSKDRSTCEQYLVRGVLTECKGDLLAKCEVAALISDFWDGTEFGYTQGPFERSCPGQDRHRYKCRLVIWYKKNGDEGGRSCDRGSNENGVPDPCRNDTYTTFDHGC